MRNVFGVGKRKWSRKNRKYQARNRGGVAQQSVGWVTAYAPQQKKGAIISFPEELEDEDDPIKVLQFGHVDMGTKFPKTNSSGLGVFPDNQLVVFTPNPNKPGWATNVRLAAGMSPKKKPKRAPPLPSFQYSDAPSAKNARIHQSLVQLAEDRGYPADTIPPLSDVAFKPVGAAKLTLAYFRTQFLGQTEQWKSKRGHPDRDKATQALLDEVKNFVATTTGPNLGKVRKQQAIKKGGKSGKRKGGSASGGGGNPGPAQSGGGGGLGGGGGGGAPSSRLPKNIPPPTQAEWESETVSTFRTKFASCTKVRQIFGVFKDLLTPLTTRSTTANLDSMATGLLQDSLDVLAHLKDRKGDVSLLTEDAAILVRIEEMMLAIPLVVAEALKCLAHKSPLEVRVTRKVEDDLAAETMSGGPGASTLAELPTFVQHGVIANTAMSQVRRADPAMPIPAGAAGAHLASLQSKALVPAPRTQSEAKYFRDNFVALVNARAAELFSYARNLGCLKVANRSVVPNRSGLENVNHASCYSNCDLQALYPLLADLRPALAAAQFIPASDYRSEDLVVAVLATIQAMKSSAKFAISTKLIREQLSAYYGPWPWTSPEEGFVEGRQEDAFCAMNALLAALDECLPVFKARHEVVLVFPLLCSTCGHFTAKRILPVINTLSYNLQDHTPYKYADYLSEAMAEFGRERLFCPCGLRAKLDGAVHLDTAPDYIILLLNLRLQNSDAKKHMVLGLEEDVFDLSANVTPGTNARYRLLNTGMHMSGTGEEGHYALAELEGATETGRGVFIRASDSALIRHVHASPGVLIAETPFVVIAKRVDSPDDMPTLGSPGAPVASSTPVPISASGSSFLDPFATPPSLITRAAKAAVSAVQASLSTDPTQASPALGRTQASSLMAKLGFSSCDEPYHILTFAEIQTVKTATPPAHWPSASASSGRLVAGGAVTKKVARQRKAHARLLSAATNALGHRLSVYASSSPQHPVNQ